MEWKEAVVGPDRAQENLDDRLERRRYCRACFILMTKRGCDKIF